MKRTISVLLVMVVLFALAACGKQADTPAEPVSFTVIVTDLEGNETAFEYASNAVSVGKALVAEGLVEGHEASYGLYIDAVNGIAAIGIYFTFDGGNPFVGPAPTGIIGMIPFLVIAVFMLISLKHKKGSPCQGSCQKSI